MKLKLNLSKGAQKLQTKRDVQSRGHILLVDDEPENLDGLQALLEGEGYQVSATTQPAEALEITQSTKVDLIISDQRMPMMLGTELLSAVKADSDDNVRVILTGHTDMNDLITCINNGLLYRYLVKPWRAEEVLSVVEQGMKKIRIERTVQKLVPGHIWQRLYEGRLEETGLGEGRALDCVVAFIDILDFQRLSAPLTPSQTFYLISEIMGALDPIIRAHHGYVTKYQGDGVTVVFDRSESCAQDALSCLSRFDEQLTQLNDTLREPMSVTGGRAVAVGVGAHIGRALIGTVGSSDRMDFTVLGEVVNIASRVEAFAERLSSRDRSCVAVVTRELLSQAHAEPPSDHFESLGTQNLTGIQDPLELFEITL